MVKGRCIDFLIGIDYVILLIILLIVVGLKEKYLGNDLGMLKINLKFFD